MGAYKNYILKIADAANVEPEVLFEEIILDDEALSGHLVRRCHEVYGQKTADQFVAILRRLAEGDLLRATRLWNWVDTLGVPEPFWALMQVWTPWAFRRVDSVNSMKFTY